MRKNKKGFTIVELVIVIAVIAVLTAVLVPTFIHLSSKAKDSIDKTVVKNANIQLAAKEALEGKNKSMSDAVKDVDEIGYHIPGVETANGNKIVWDSVADRFVLFDKDNEVLLKDSQDNPEERHSKLFYAVSRFADHEDFAIYAKADFPKEISFTEAVSFDAGETGKKDVEDSHMTSITYNFSGAGGVLVATNSEKTVLTVTAGSAEFTHVGLAKEEIIHDVKSDTFTEYGKVGFVQIDKGHYVADKGSDVKTVYVSDDAAKVDQLNGGVIHVAYGKDDTVQNLNHNVDLIDLSTSGKDVEDIEDAAIEELDKDVNPSSDPYADAGENDYFALLDENGNFVEYLSLISDTDDISDGSKIIMIKDNTQIFTYVSQPKTLTLDLNGHDLDLTSQKEGIGAFNGGKLIIMDSQYGTVNKGSMVIPCFDIMPAMWSAAGCVEIESGYFRLLRNDWGNAEGLSIPPVLKGGTFNRDPNSATIASGYHAVDNGNGTWSVVAD